MHQKLTFWGQKKRFWGRGSVPFTASYPLDAYGASPSPYWNPKYATDYCTRLMRAVIVNWVVSMQQLWPVWNIGHPNGPAYSTGELLNTPLVLYGSSVLVVTTALA